MEFRELGGSEKENEKKVRGDLTGGVDRVLHTLGHKYLDVSTLRNPTALPFPSPLLTAHLISPRMRLTAKEKRYHCPLNPSFN